MDYVLFTDASGNTYLASYTHAPEQLPNGQVLATEADQIANPQNYQVQNGAIVAAPTSAILASAQSSQIAKVNMAYDYATSSPPNVSYTSVAGVSETYQCGPDSVSNLSGCLLGYQAAQATPPGFAWKAASNAMVPFTFSDLQKLAAVMVAQAQASWQRQQTLKAQIQAATTVAAVQAINW